MLLAIVKTLTHFHIYLYEQKFHLRTYQSTWHWLLNFKNLEGRKVGCDHFQGTILYQNMVEGRANGSVVG
jgi:hypothetical protein